MDVAWFGNLRESVGRPVALCFNARISGYVDGPNSPVALYVLTSICERELGADEKNRSGRFSRETSDAFGL